MAAQHRSTSKNKNVIQKAGSALIASLFFLFALAGLLAGTANADDTPLLPGQPIIRSSDRGITNAGPADVRTAELGAVQGGTVSKGAPIPLGDGNAASLPKLHTPTWWGTSEQASVGGDTSMIGAAD